MFSFRIKIKITFSTKYWQCKSKKIKIIKKRFTVSSKRKIFFPIFNPIL